MFVIAIAVAIASAGTTPTAEAERLGLEVAESGSLAAMLPLITAKETEELVADHPELSPAEIAVLRSTAREVADRSSARLMAAMGHGYAASLPMAELRAIATFNRTPAAAHYRAAIPKVMAKTMAAVGQIDFKRETLTAFCGKTGKACPKPEK